MTVVVEWIGVALMAYLIGSLPLSYLVGKWSRNVDLRQQGSRNVGARNLFDVTGSLTLALLAAVLDAAKGAVAVLLTQWLFPDRCELMAGALFFAVTGHNYPLWLRFHGGRGLATAAGGFLVFHPLPIAIFLLMWITGYVVIRPNVHVGNVTAALGTPILLWSTPPAFVEWFRTIPCVSSSLLVITTVMVCLQIFVRHLEPIQQLFRDASKTS